MNSLRPIRSCIFALALVGLFASSAVAQVDVPASCEKGNGTYSGDLSGECRYYDFRNPSRKVIFMEGDLAKAFEPGTSGGEHTFKEFNADGSFMSTTTHIIRDHVITIQGKYTDCTVSGTWSIDFADDRPTMNGTFEMEGTAPTASETAIELCGVLGTGAFATPAMMLVGASIMRRRRRS